MRTVKATINSTSKIEGIKTLKENEIDHIKHVLSISSNRSMIARTLGIDRRTLYRKLHDYGLENRIPIKDTSDDISFTVPLRD